ncbi:MAG TPA: EAL domain-containing protein [Usitatibacter sp.]|nr:EAL domain-containing protein [Usitatibacter sp.]
MTNREPAPPLATRLLPATARPAAIVWLFAGLVVVLLGITMYGSHILASGRAFVAAEAAWAKAQKDAVFHLTLYAREGTPVHLEAYEAAMRVIEGDRSARIEFTREEPDIEAVRRGLRAGGVHPGEIEGLLHLYQRFRTFGPMEYVLSLWIRSDVHVEALQRIAARLRNEAPLAPAAATAVAREIHNIDRALNLLEEDFSQTLGDMQRTAEALFVGGILVITGVLLIGAITLSRRFLVQNERLQQTLAESESQLRHLVEAAPLPLLIVGTAEQRLLYANEVALAHFGLHVDSARAHSLADFYVDAEHRAAVSEAFSRAGSARNMEVRLKDVGGRESWMLLSAQPVRYEGQLCLLVALANIDDRKRMQEDMRRKAMHDPLTGLPNRAMFMESLERAVAKAKRRHARFSVLFIDLDRFKEVNDSMGHAAGDALLKTMAQRLGTAVRQSDIVARLGGDEFVILIEEHGGPEEVMIVAQKALDLLQRPVTIDWREAEVSGSIGIASYPEDGLDVEALVKNADVAMYQAKERGRNNFQFYSEDLNLLSARRMEQEKRVRGALERDEFFLEYQPEIDFATGRIAAVEALLRWREGPTGVVLPAEFMPLAEETGAAAAIGVWVLDRALADLRSWHQKGMDLKLSVNLSARQVQQHDLVEEMKRLLDRHGVAPRHLRVEIKEPTLLADSEAVHRTVRALKVMGIEIAIDNFGSGYSSLGLLRGLPVQVVKIDRTLVSSCPSKRECAAIVQAAASMARVMGVRVIAEGVETDEQRQVVASLGCDGAQGYFFARPVDASRVALLRNEASAATAAD